MPTPRIPNNWADAHIEALNRGETVRFRPRGHSMTPIVKDNQLVTVLPVSRAFPDNLPGPIGSVVLCKVGGKVLLHKIVKWDSNGYTIGNNRGRINGRAETIYGVCISVED